MVILGKFLSFSCSAAIVMALGFLLQNPSQVRAQAPESTFNVGLQVFSADLGPPSIPTGLSGTPQTTTQISLTWTASTDDIAVFGYVLYRDGIPLATTTSTSYVDTGLVASTTYEYAVNAFDQAGYYSATSSSIFVTTLSVPPPATSTPTATSTRRSGGGGSYRVVNEGEFSFRISDIRAISYEHSLIVMWNTNLPSTSKVSWGRTSDNELGSTYRIQYETSHTMVIDRLNAGTMYNLRLESATQSGSITSEGLSISTVLPYEEQFQNPYNLAAVPANSDGKVSVTWSSMTMSSSTEVRVVRSDKFYPQDPYDGKIVYEGTGSQAYDQLVGSDSGGFVAYYSLFTKDGSGNFSSGVTARYASGKSKADEKNPDYKSDPSVDQLGIGSMEVFQHGIRVYADRTQTFAVSDDAVVQVVLPIMTQDNNTKLVLISIAQPNREDLHNISYIFTYAKEKGGYVAYIPQGALVYGHQNFTITYFGFDNKAKAVIQASFEKNKSGFALGSTFSGFVQQISYFVNRFFYILMLVWLLILALIYIKRIGRI